MRQAIRDSSAFAELRVLVDIPAVGLEFEQSCEVFGGMGLLSRAWAAGVQRQKCHYALKSCHDAPRSAQACRHGV